jgi:hypothetical protein
MCNGGRPGHAVTYLLCHPFIPAKRIVQRFWTKSATGNPRYAVRKSYGRRRRYPAGVSPVARRKTRVR